MLRLNMCSLPCAVAAATLPALLQGLPDRRERAEYGTASLLLAAEGQQLVTLRLPPCRFVSTFTRTLSRLRLWLLPLFASRQPRGGGDLLRENVSPSDRAGELMLELLESRE